MTRIEWKIKHGIRTIAPCRDTGGMWLAVVSAESPHYDGTDVVRSGESEEDALVFVGLAAGIELFEGMP
jgi:hypothetical protein